MIRDLRGKWRKNKAKMAGGGETATEREFCKLLIMRDRTCNYFFMCANALLTKPSVYFFGLMRKQELIVTSNTSETTSIMLQTLRARWMG